MKRLVMGLLAAALSLGLAACYWNTNAGLGGIALELPAGVTPKGPGDSYARVWVVANGAVYPLGDGTDYVQKRLPEDDGVTITVEGIPVGPVYRVWLSIVEEQPGGWYRTYSWAESAPFELFAGARAAVVFEYFGLNSEVFYPVTDYMDSDTMMGRSLLNVEVNIDSIYAAEPGALHHVESFDFATYTENLSVRSLPAPAGRRINSVSLAMSDWGSRQVGVNTDRGIYPYNWEDFGPAITGNLGGVSILDSETTSHFWGGNVLYFRGVSGWGGTYSGAEQPAETWKWANHDAGTVWDLAAQDDEGGAFFATSEGAFFVDGQYLAELSSGEIVPNLADYRQVIRAPHRILCLDYWSYEGDALYMGTDNGLYYAETPDGETSIIATPQLVAGTEGYRIRRVAVVDGSYPALGAALSDAYVFVFTGDTVVKTFPLAAGLPGRVTDLAWYSSYLLVSGSEGLVYYDY